MISISIYKPFRSLEQHTHAKQLSRSTIPSSKAAFQDHFSC